MVGVGPVSAHNKIAASRSFSNKSFELTVCLLHCAIVVAADVNAATIICVFI
jgi:hypothetical protein